ncbi:hypothetical protein C8R46DRAFT_1057186 [Mycena filopes]|nr:hypothetical protein C8R46DRAFT_1057186 [Mycena filopes]
MSPHVFKAQVISGEGVPAPGIAQSTWTTRMCDFRDCKNHENLNKCARCRTAMYCSKTCQRADWAGHKPFCKMVTDFPAAMDPVTGGEPALQRHLRLWTARFNGSLICAAIVALELNKKFSNIDTLGLVIILHPRPHAEAGSRFSFVSAMVTPIQEMMDQFLQYHTNQAVDAAAGGPNLMELHQQHRAELKTRSAGQEDFATMFVVARNVGPHALPGGPDTEIRFKPIGVHRRMVRSPQLTDPTLDWYTTLKYQIERDIPNRAVVQ